MTKTAEPVLASNIKLRLHHFEEKTHTNKKTAPEVQK
jgi:hypothetical protein